MATKPPTRKYRMKLNLLMSHKRAHIRNQPNIAIDSSLLLWDIMIRDTISICGAFCGQLFSNKSRHADLPQTLPLELHQIHRAWKNYPEIHLFLNHGIRLDQTYRAFAWFLRIQLTWVQERAHPRRLPLKNHSNWWSLARFHRWYHLFGFGVS